jgi:hypothetical protein
MLHEDMPGRLPVSVLALSKSDMKDDEGQYNIGAIWETLERNLKDLFPFDLLLSWEQAVHDATTATSHTLSEHAIKLCDGRLSEAWCGSLSSVFNALIKAAIGQQPLSEMAAASSLYAILNALHMDLLEQTGLTICPISSDGKANLEGNNLLLDDEGRSRLNSMLFTSNVGLTNDNVQPGSIYLLEEWEHAIVPLFSDDRDRFLNSIFNANDLDDIKAMKARKKEGEAITNKDIDKLCSDLRRAYSDSSKQVMLEITPPCDFSQNKQGANRFIMGVVINYRYLPAIIKADFLKKIGPFQIEGMNEPIVLVLSARHPAATKVNALNITPITRLRHQLLTDIQSWSASQSARVGYLSL